MGKKDRKDNGPEGSAFVWLERSGWAKNGRRMKQGAIHDAENFPARTLNQWIKTGSARWATLEDIKSLPGAAPDVPADLHLEGPVSPEEVNKSGSFWPLAYYHDGEQESAQRSLFDDEKGKELTRLQAVLGRAGFSVAILSEALDERKLARMFGSVFNARPDSLVEYMQAALNEMFAAGDSREARIKWFWFINVLFEKLNKYRIESATPDVRRALVLTTIAEMAQLFFGSNVENYGRELPANYFKSKERELLRLPRSAERFTGNVLPRIRLRAKSKQIETEDRGAVYVWKVSGPDGVTWEYRFDRDLLLDSKGKERMPSPAGMNDDIRAEMRLLLAKKQNPLVYTDREKLHALGIQQPSGDDYEQTRANHRALAGFRRIEKDESGRILGIKSSPYREVRLSDPKNGNPWNVTRFDDDMLAGVNPKTFILEGGTFKTLPAGKKYRGMKQRAFEYLIMNVSGRSLTVNGDTLLAALGATKDALRSKRKALYILDTFFQAARAELFDYEINGRGSGKQHLIDMLQKHTLREIEKSLPLKNEKGEKTKLQDPLFLGDCKKWQIIIYSPAKLRRLTAEENKLISEIIKWGYHGREDFGQTTPAGVAERQLSGVVKALGGPAVSEIWRDIMAGPRFIEGQGGETINQWAALWAKLKEARREKFEK